MGPHFDEEDENLVRASADGEILVKNGVLHVSQIHTVKGDIDYSTGNLKFNGSIKIGGTVKAGFEVIAEGSVEINGNVEDAKILAGGDVVVAGILHAFQFRASLDRAVLVEPPALGVESLLASKPPRHSQVSHVHAHAFQEFHVVGRRQIVRPAHRRHAAAKHLLDDGEIGFGFHEGNFRLLYTVHRVEVTCFVRLAHFYSVN